MDGHHDAPDFEYRGHAERRRYVLEDTGFNEVPKKHRRFYRRWLGPDDVMAPNEVLCPICKVVLRSERELRAGDRIYCMTCMARFELVLGAGGQLVAEPIH